MKRPAGFTLLELLVALAVLAVLGALGWRGLDAVLGAEARAAFELARWDGLDQAMQQLERDRSRAAYRVRDGKLEYLGGASPLVLATGVAALEVRSEQGLVRAEIVLASGERAWRLFLP